MTPLLPLPRSTPQGSTRGRLMRACAAGALMGATVAVTTAVAAPVPGTVLPVTSTVDTGDVNEVGSLSWAIDQANQAPNSTIQFAVPDGSTITSTATLPSLTQYTELQTQATVTIAAPLDATGTLVLDATGSLVLAGDGTVLQDGLLVNGGTVVLGDGTATVQLTASTLGGVGLTLADGTGGTISATGSVTGAAGRRGAGATYQDPNAIGGNGGSGGAGISAGVALVTNAGTISGGSGGEGGTAYSGGAGGAAGAGVYGLGTTVDNTGAITGGIGGAGGYGFYRDSGNGGAGGAGIAGADLKIDNAASGHIAGGSGGLSIATYSTNSSGTGAGGAGGAGILATGSSTIINAGSVAGGAGGLGSTAQGFPYLAGGSPANPLGGNGGAGGAGISGSGFYLKNTGSVTGGNGGAAGGHTDQSVGGAGGVGVVSNGGSVIFTSGLIAGGVSGSYGDGSGGGVQADAVDLSGGGNVLALEAGYSLVGNVVSTSGTTDGGDILALGGDTDQSFDLSAIVATAPTTYDGTTEFSGFNGYVAFGPGTLTLTGASDAATSWVVVGGGLQVGTDAATATIVGSTEGVLGLSDAAIYAATGTVLSVATGSSVTGSAGSSGAYSGYHTGTSGADGGTAVEMNGAYASSNQGSLTGGAGGTGGTGVPGGAGGAGGQGLVLSGTTFSNGGSITGGAGGTGGFAHHIIGNQAGDGGAGGEGAYLTGSSLTNTGTVTGGAGGLGGLSGHGGAGGTGGAGVSGTGFVLTNAGTVQGGTGGAATEGSFYIGTSGTGGAGVSGSDGTVYNSGEILGGTGGASGVSRAYRTAAGVGTGGAGGTGISSTGLTVVNSGTISGGAGGTVCDADCTGLFYSSLADVGVSGGAGGAGITANGLTLTNSGTVTGGAGAAGGVEFAYSSSSTVTAGSGGAGGAGITGQAMQIVNTGTIQGGNGGDAGTGTTSATGGAGGVGVIATGNTTLVNAGLIAGGVSGASSDGTGGGVQADAVDFSGGGNTLVLEAGYSFTGNVVSTSGTTNGGDTLVIGGSLNGDFDLSQIVAVEPTSYTGSVEYYGFTTISKVGTGKWVLSGIDTTPENWLVGGGKLIVGDADHKDTVITGPVTVQSGGTLGGYGTIVGNVLVNAGGTASPGNSIGTLTVNGNYDQQGTLAIEVDATGATDQLAVTGTVTLGSASELLITGLPDNSITIANAGTASVIIDNQGTSAVQGTFGTVDNELAFYNAAVSYTGGTGNDVTLTFTRNTTTLTDVAITQNQKSVATALGTIGSGTLTTAILGLTTAETRTAYDQLSGEIGASVETALIDNSQYTRTAVNRRLNEVLTGGAGPTGGGLDHSSCIGTTVSVGKTLSCDGGAAWGTAYGGWTTTNGKSGTARLTNGTGGMFLGADTRLGDDWHAGVMAGYGHGTYTLEGRNSRATSDDSTIAAYAGTQQGPLGIRVGAAFTRSSVDSRRDVSLPTFSDNLTAHYATRTLQVFGNASYRIDTGNGTSITPFADLAHVALRGDAFTETGGAAALTTQGGKSNVTFTTLGVSTARGLRLDGAAMTATMSLGWRHAFGDTDPQIGYSLAGSSAFSITGAPIARNSALVELGLSSALSDRARIGIAYNGAFAEGARSQSVSALFSIRF
ncbi:autotransporter domain-containing protein [Acidimangrovimonas sediminis]|uniref:autotransporter domain-containing protein n=1 Tax=Acidimangrovimonas sediminis TaxID=2056283 RepID=UPI000C7F989E|nr:autotransporter domain-containing protein [Acidimangrovimonas sediminis]